MTMFETLKRAQNCSHGLPRWNEENIFRFSRYFPNIASPKSFFFQMFANGPGCVNHSSIREQKDKLRNRFGMLSFIIFYYSQDW